MNGRRQAVLLDSYGTLVRASNPVPWFRRLVDLAGEFGAAIDEAVARQAAMVALRFLNQHTSVRTVEEEHQVYRAYYALLLQGLGVRGDLPAWAAQLNERFRIRQCWLEPFEETLPVLEALRAAGYRLAVVSDGFPSLRVDYERLGLAGYFDAIVVAAELGAWKPDRRVYDAALRRLEVPVEQCLYLDDTPDDASGAAAVGIDAFLLDRQDRYADHALPRVATLREFVGRIGILVG